LTFITEGNKNLPPKEEKKEQCPTVMENNNQQP
jgi:hypothetical protein